MNLKMVSPRMHPQRQQIRTLDKSQPRSASQRSGTRRSCQKERIVQREHMQKDQIQNGHQVSRFA